MLLRSAVDTSATPVAFDGLKTPKRQRFYSVLSLSPPPSAQMPSTPETPCPSRPPSKDLKSKTVHKVEDDVFSDTPKLLFDTSPANLRSPRPETTTHCDKEHELPIVDQTSPLADVDPGDVVAITFKCSRRDLETCSFVNRDVIATLQDMEEDGLCHSPLGKEGLPLVVLKYRTYRLPEEANLQ
ncbi:hypothetical protein CcaverHIS002_0700870 [Cutaneotrichosporon cavernicola]|uniref:Uncharacterized protein n=1 Tax=Cutaneotrichosporon cavernicola TaxID=279322 RepID=A0AA48QYL6_9TREE|nr:uncharacterized protein CcaverHIS019_0700880 [Cutaneotrichosporon cavernicola]BEI86741.1 hypothetical protein CcaverHIS002_0700870 [Cutaneotrichosporon cavernicola]BEI94516.1 hypothetical protein CcaverHIS019_0700880 [Cutaneotrichosporon cavernicola]BEJ02292.1 hypothetical protein CcaverHIS631_0700870 [Cutaneotrichosporon cavernicola]BEJ10051.1 hypothetical protein CcaverHIS641_0700860 [Cutaneotrichosporon cavernicola]